MAMRPNGEGEDNTNLPGRAINVLIVDDDEIAHYLVKKGLSRISDSIQTKVAIDGNDALQQIKKRNENFDVIFVDLNMPGMNGFELLSELEKDKEAIENTAVYVLTSSFYEKDLQQASSYQIVEEAISKPITRNKLEQILVDLDRG